MVLLDIGLPVLNGIEAAGQIHRLVPSAKIIFLTQESSPDVVKEAFSVGASGYVVKTQAGTELLRAVEAVLLGEQFFSGGVQLRDSPSTAVRSDSPDFPTSDARPGQEGTERTRHHEVLFYSNEASLLESFALFTGTALRSGNAAIVIAFDMHRVILRRKLEAQGVDVAAASREGRYFPLDVSETLAMFMIEGMPSEIRFAKGAGDLLRKAAMAVDGDYRRISACGECAPSLWAEGSAEATIRLEHLWDEVAKSYGVDILCGYATNSFRGDKDRHVFERICAEHSLVQPGETTA